jgi:hypothetical protein
MLRLTDTQSVVQQKQMSALSLPGSRGVRPLIMDAQSEYRRTTTGSRPMDPKAALPASR